MFKQAGAPEVISRDVHGHAFSADLVASRWFDDHPYHAHRGSGNVYGEVEF